jgi:hypothetical protein
LVRDAYLSEDDGRTWRLEKWTRFEDTSGLSYESNVEVTYAFAEPIPESGNAPCELTVSARLYEYDAQSGIDEGYEGELYSVPCVAEDITSLRRVRYAELAGEDALADQLEWEAFLDSIDYEAAHPQWARLLLRGHDMAVLYRQSSRTDYFSNSSIGSWRRSPVAPPLD